MSHIELSRPIQEALERSLDVSVWIGEHHSADLKDSRRHRLAGPFFGICMDHREAILVLIDHDCRSAAFALWRSVYEALVRGLWAVQCSTDADFERIAATRELPKFETMVRQLDKIEDGSPYTYGESKQRVWRSMSHFAHGGVEQLARWAGADGIGARHPDIEVVRLLAQLDLYGLLASMEVMKMAGGSIDEHQERIKLHLESARPQWQESPSSANANAAGASPAPARS